MNELVAAISGVLPHTTLPDANTKRGPVRRERLRST